MIILKKNKEYLNHIKDTKDYYRSYPIDFETLPAEEIVGNKDINLYVHIPFCRGGCYFCPFNRFFWRDEQVKAYLLALQKEIELIKKRINIDKLTIRTLWIGGGTPSDLNSSQINQLFQILLKQFKLKEIEMTFEGIADGHSFSKDKTNVLKKFGVRNISLGVQSLQENFLRNILIRRYHEPDARKTIRFLRQEGFFLNADMMYRLPGESLSQFETDIKEIISEKVNHITCFPFMLVRNTPIRNLIEKGKLPQRPDKTTYLKMYKRLLAIMHYNKYFEYTPYHFGKNHSKIQYHVDRWCFPQKETLGIGAGAFSFYNHVQYTNIHKIDEYIQTVNKGKIPVLVGKKANTFEGLTRYAVLGMKGLTIDKTEFEQVSGFQFDTIFHRQIQQLRKKRLIKNSKMHITLTTLGKAFSNEVSNEFYCGENEGKPQPMGVDFKS